MEVSPKRGRYPTSIEIDGVGTKAQHGNNIVNVDFRHCLGKRVLGTAVSGGGGRFHSRATADMAKAYGFSTVEIEKFPSAPLSQPTKGQLWGTAGQLRVTETLGPRKLHDSDDTPVALGGNTPTTAKPAK